MSSFLHSLASLVKTIELKVQRWGGGGWAKNCSDLSLRRLLFSARSYTFFFHNLKLFLSELTSRILTDELCGGRGQDVRDVVGRRRGQRAQSRSHPRPGASGLSRHTQACQIWPQRYQGQDEAKVGRLCHYYMSCYRCVLFCFLPVGNSVWWISDK